MKPKRRLLIMIYIAFLALLAEGASYLGLLGLSAIKGLRYEAVLSAPLPRQMIESIARIASSTGQYQVFDHDLGWTLARSARSLDGRYTTGPLGSRNTARDPSAFPQPSLRIAAYGDSYVHGDEVADSETWEFALERAHPSWSVINYGVGGYGPDQAYLRYKATAASPRADLVIIGYMSENIQRVTNVFRPFYYSNTELPFSKPRYKIVQNKLLLIPNPLAVTDYRLLLTSPDSILRTLGTNDWYYNNLPRKSTWDVLATVRLVKLLWNERHREKVLLPTGLYNTRAEAYLVTLKILKQFAGNVTANHQTPVVVMFPSASDVRRMIGGKDSRYSPLVKDLAMMGVCVIDLEGAFADIGTRRALSDVFRQTHYSPLGNEHVARFLGARLDKFAGVNQCPQ